MYIISILKFAIHPAVIAVPGEASGKLNLQKIGFCVHDL